MWDDDIEIGGDDLIDNFTIPIPRPTFHSKGSNSLTVNGTAHIGILKVAFHNLTTSPSPYQTGDNAFSACSQVSERK